MKIEKVVQESQIQMKDAGMGDKHLIYIYETGKIQTKIKVDVSSHLWNERCSKSQMKFKVLWTTQSNLNSPWRYQPKSAGWKSISGTRKRSLVRTISCTIHMHISQYLNRHTLASTSNRAYTSLFVNSMLLKSLVDLSPWRSSPGSVVFPWGGSAGISSAKIKHLCASLGSLT